MGLLCKNFGVEENIFLEDYVEVKDKKNYEELNEDPIIEKQKSGN